jgi:hypothetical protein
MSLPRRFPMSRPSPTGAALRSAALTRVSLRGFWSSSLIVGQKRAGFCPLDKLHTSVSGLPHHVQCSTPHASVPFENSLASDRYGSVCAGRRAGCFRGRTGLRLPSGHHHEPFSLAQGNMHRPCTSTASATSSFRTSNWTNSAPGCATPSRSCGSGWPSTLAQRFFPCSLWVPVPNIRRIVSFTPCDRSWPPFCLPVFTSDGLNVYFSALTAHFGHWRGVGRCGPKALRWQVAAGLIYGQVKKNYRRRKLVRVTPVMRLGTEADLKGARPRLGLSGRLNTAFIERVNLTVRHGVAALARRTWATAQQSPHLLAHLEWWRAYSHFVRPIPRCG